MIGVRSTLCAQHQEPSLMTVASRRSRKDGGQARGGTPVMPKACLVMFLMPTEQQREERAPRGRARMGAGSTSEEGDGCRGWAGTCYPGLLLTV